MMENGTLPRASEVLNDIRSRLELAVSRRDRAQISKLIDDGTTLFDDRVDELGNEALVDWIDLEARAKDVLGGIGVGEAPSSQPTPELIVNTPETQGLALINSINASIKEQNAKISEVLKTNQVDRDTLLTIGTAIIELEGQLVEIGLTDFMTEIMVVQALGQAEQSLERLKSRYNSLKNRYDLIGQKSDALDIDLNTWPESEHPQLARDLKALVARLEASLADPDYDPDLLNDTARLENLIGDFQQQVLDIDRGVYRDVHNVVAVVNGLRKTYLLPAQDLGRRLLERRQEIADKKFGLWMVDVAKIGNIVTLQSALNAPLPPNPPLTDPQVHINGLDIALSVAKTDPALARFSADSREGKYLEATFWKKAEEKLQALKLLKDAYEAEKMKNKENLEYADWRRNVDGLVKIIETIETDVDKAKIMPHSSDPLAKNERQLRALKTQLTSEKTTADAAGYTDHTQFNNQRIERELDRLVGLNKTSGRYGEALEKIDDCINISQQETKEVVARNKREKQFFEIIASEKPTKGGGALSELISKANDIRDSAKEVSETEGKLWEIKLKVWDAWIKSANADVVAQIAWQDVTAARQKIAGEVGLQDMRDFMELDPRNKEMALKCEEIFLSGPFRFVDDMGRPLKDTSGEYIGVLRDPTTKQVVLDPVTGQPTPLEHDFGRYGSPRDSEIDDGKIGLTTLLSALFPDREQSDVYTMMEIAIIGELRSKAYTPHYAAYVESPKPTFDVTPIQQAAPMAYILYKIRSIQSIPPGHRLMWKVCSLPRTAGPNMEVIDPKTGESCFSVSKFKYSGTTGAEPKTSVKGNDNVVQAIRVRELLRAFITSADLPMAELGENLAMFPFIWDLILNKEGGEYNKITFAEYSASKKAWDDFEHLAESPPKIHKEQDVTTAVGSLISAFSPLKGIYPILHGTDYYENFQDIVNQMFIFFIKEIYDQFDVLSTIPTGTLRRKRMLNLLHTVIDKSETLPDWIESYLLQSLKDGTSMALVGGDLQMRRLFGDSRPVTMPLEVMGKTIPAPLGVHLKFNNTLARYTRSLTVEEEKAGQGKDGKGH